MFFLAIACIAIAVLWICYRVYLAYNSFGGTVVVTLYDAAFYPPVLITFGLNRILVQREVELQWWVYGLIWLGVLAVVVGLIKVAEKVGDRDVW